jgi:ribosomal-protein-serine acetyltransferase
VVSILIDDELLLRSWQPEDALELYKATNASRQHLRGWLNWVDNSTKPEHASQFIQLTLQQLHAQEGLALGIFYKRQVIGGIGMHQWDHATKRAFLGYWISKEYEGKGIVHKCMSRFIDFLFEKAGLNKLEIHYMPQNKRSAKVAERLGFKPEGLIRQSHINNGIVYDLMITGLLKNEWTIDIEQ